MCIFFFFQAEDGIRDLTVTGVQTCALPISTAARGDHRERDARVVDAAGGDGPVASDRVHQRCQPVAGEIGRASCRERVESGVVDGWWERKGVGDQWWSGGGGVV